MGSFRYKAVGADGQVLEGIEEAPSRDALIARLRDKGAIPIRADPFAERAGRRGPRLSLLQRRRATAKDVARFSRDLSVLLQSGLPLDQALSTLAEFAPPGPVRTFTGEILARIQGGAPLSDAIAAAGPAFPTFYAGMVRAGEAGGTLTEVMARLAAMLEERQALAEQIRSALFYPALVLVLTGASLAVLLTLVIPQFRPLFEQSGADLPTLTKIVLGVSDTVRDYDWALALGFLALLIGLRRHNASAAGRMRWDRWSLAVPLIGDLVRRLETAKLCRVLGSLLQNGVTLLEAVPMTGRTVANKAIAQAVEQVVAPLSRGEGLARPLERTGVLPRLAVHLIRVGEESGQLHQMLLRVADIYDAEVKRTIERLLALLVPVITVGLGILIAVIIGSMLSAILQSYNLAL
jgi:general secretion pathway protein F